MPIPVACTCGHAADAPDSLAGRRVRCRKCGGTVQVPEATAARYVSLAEVEPDPDPGPELEAVAIAALIPELDTAGAAFPPVATGDEDPAGWASSVASEARPGPYAYRMVQVPPNIEVRADAHGGGVAADYLERIVNRYAREGWEFQRVDSVGVVARPGCLASLLGQSATTTVYYVITFRRPS